jgi:hypothetical protein
MTKKYSGISRLTRRQRHFAVGMIFCFEETGIGGGEAREFLTSAGI